MRDICLALAIAAAATPAAAHDFWLQPNSFWTQPSGALTTAIQVGHGPDRRPWAIDTKRVLLFRSLGPDGVVDRRPALNTRVKDGEVQLTFGAAGAYVLAFQTNHAESELPSLRFNDYLKLEGLTPAIELRARTKRTDTAGKEIYSRRAKVLVQSGPVDAKTSALVTKPVGLSLEIVPERNPYALGPNDPLPVQVLYEGRPLPGALVKLTNLDFDARPLQTQVTDAGGRASFNVPLVGSWLINVLWTKPIRGNPRADFDTTFSSLTFGYLRRGLGAP